ncbi:MAG TPA: MarR family transcriptional regulator [Leptospiraceae bacterium]|nr:MarR family transcriptional regulator [Leptospiraceae bacterium]HMW04466.1 MarR family transcriptional regulator [Leptospiraceae bacterium]HMX31124.1 MarR family transcriptional regulator [Leptospiraceae bacterium]HMY30652.1 MarR family transcriptional regulator [Leptospiraceae bacterium]HMZ65815.1 MarR family transcriptional regulator [Leptospiraceae bacterium]
MSSKKTFSVEKAEDSSGFLLWQVTSIWQREIRKALDPLGLTHSQFVLLASIFWLILHNEEVTQIKLSDHTKIDPMTTSTVLRTLQAKGYLKRKEHTTDTRAKTVILTKEGEEITKQAVKIVEKFDKQFFASLGDKTNDFNKKLILLLESSEKE